MEKCKSLFCTLLLTILFLNSYATWSIIVIDPQTNKIGIAGASCTNSVYGIGAIVPGKGAVVVQAMSNFFARVKGLEMIMTGASPKDIIQALKDPRYNPEVQQYAIVSMQYLDSPATYTGTSTTGYKGALTASGISVQGNTLASPEVLQSVFDAVLKARKDSLSIEEILMLALETGATYGGDNRCGDIKALSAFITVVKPGDDPKNPYLNLIVYGTGNKVNAVDALRQKFNDWKIEEGK